MHFCCALVAQPACLLLPVQRISLNLMMRSAWQSRATWWSGYHKRHSGATPLTSVSSHPTESVCIATRHANYLMHENVNSSQSMHPQQCPCFSISTHPPHHSPSWASHRSSTANRHKKVAHHQGLICSLESLSARFSTFTHGDSQKSRAQGGSKSSTAHTDFARKNMPVWLHVMKRKR